MVRFSDMLGGGEADDSRASTDTTELAGPVDETPGPDPDAAPPGDDAQFVDEAAVAPSQSPQDVLDRLVQYASSARAAEQNVAPDAAALPDPSASAPLPTPPEASEPAPAPPDERAGDDLLPRSRRIIRRPGRDPKRRP
jgi:hypothetical protein